MRLAELVSRFESQCIARYGHRLLPGARQALRALKHCRSDDGQHLLAGCPQCLSTAVIPHSCGHRSCPHCQHHHSERWLARQCHRLLPVDYFLVTFTLPAQLRQLAWAHQRVVFGAMLHCAWDCLATFARNDPKLSVDIGATAVLHTHNRRLDFHPHIHLVVPAGGIDRARTLWRRKDRYLFNERNLANVFRAKLLSALHALTLGPIVKNPSKWIADCRNVGRGDKALGYLARYLYRGVLSERDIIACDHGDVTFRYTDNKTRKSCTRTLHGADFLWLLLQHVLPKGFRRVRDYGLLHHKRKTLLKRVQALLHVTLKPPATPVRPPIRCPQCGTPMRVLETRLPCVTPDPSKGSQTTTRRTTM